MLPNSIETTSANLPAAYENAKRALADCVAIDACKDWSDKAAAIASYAKQAQDEELMQMARRIRGRAERRIGELLKQIEPAAPGPKKIEGGTSPYLSPRKQAAADAGLSLDQAKNAIRVANVPQESFDEMIEGDEPATITAIASEVCDPKNTGVPLDDIGSKKDRHQ